MEVIGHCDEFMQRKAALFLIVTEYIQKKIRHLLLREKRTTEVRNGSCKESAYFLRSYSHRGQR